MAASPCRNRQEPTATHVTERGLDLMLRVKHVERRLTAYNLKTLGKIATDDSLAVREL